MYICPAGFSSYWVCTIVLQVMARQHAAAGAQQLQHQTVANGDKYALPEKVAAKNKPVSI